MELMIGQTGNSEASIPEMIVRLKLLSPGVRSRLPELPVLKRSACPYSAPLTNMFCMQLGLRHSTFGASVLECTRQVTIQRK